MYSIVNCSSQNSPQGVANLTQIRARQPRGRQLSAGQQISAVSIGISVGRSNAKKSYDVGVAVRMRGGDGAAGSSGLLEGKDLRELYISKDLNTVILAQFAVFLSIHSVFENSPDCSISETRSGQNHQAQT
jgi:hypothetical protein